MSRLLSVTLVVVIAGLAVWGWLALPRGSDEGADGPWGGVDVNVIERYATEAGREPRSPLINTDQGDLLLFVFAFGGATGGFVLGYSWRKLISERKDRQPPHDA